MSSPSCLLYLKPRVHYTWHNTAYIVVTHHDINVAWNSVQFCVQVVQYITECCLTSRQKIYNSLDFDSYKLIRYSDFNLSATRKKRLAKESLYCKLIPFICRSQRILTCETTLGEKCCWSGLLVFWCLQNVSKDENILPENIKEKNRLFHLWDLWLASEGKFSCLICVGLLLKM